MKFSLLLPIFVTYILSSLGPAYAGSDFGAEDDNYVVMLSLDGFRHDYLDKYDAPNLERLVATGINSKGLVPGFPSSTFPNHYSIVTGLYPGNHGLIGNSFYHRERGQKYAMKNAKAVTDGSWYGGLPLWQAVQQAGMPTASFFWVGRSEERFSRNAETVQ